MRLSHFFIFIFVLIEQLSQPLHAVPTDFNSDKKSDIILVEIATDNSLTWNVYNKSNEKISSIVKTGSLGDNLIPALWDGKKTSLGYVAQEGTSVRWSIAQLKSFYLGKTSDVLMSGGDFDGDKKADAVAIKKDSRALTWSFIFDPVKKNLRKTDRFGKPDDIPFFINVSGKKDVPALLRSSNILLRNIANKKITKISLPFTPTTRPLPLKQRSNRDAMSFITKSQGSSEVRTVSEKGILISNVTVPSDGESIVGDFLSAPGEELAFQTSSGFYILNPFSQTTEEIQASSGIPVDEINIHSFAPDDSSNTCTNESRNPKDGGYGFLWKPKSDSDGKLAVHIPSMYTGKVDYISVVTPSGDEERGRNGGVGNGDRVLARFTKPGGSYPSNTKVVIHLSSGCTVTYVIPNTSIRVD